MKKGSNLPANRVVEQYDQARKICTQKPENASRTFGESFLRKVDRQLTIYLFIVKDLDVKLGENHK